MFDASEDGKIAWMTISQRPFIVRISVGYHNTVQNASSNVTHPCFIDTLII
jgi:hypothetical protein